VTEAVHSHRWLPTMRRPLVPSPAVAYAIRFGVMVTASIWLGKAPGLLESHSTWILITVLMLGQPTTGASLLKGLLRAVGTVAAFFTGIGLFGLFAQNPPLLMAGLFITQAIGAYGFSGPRFQYAWFVWAFTTAIVVGDAMAGQAAVETVAFERASMVLIGVVLVYVFDSLLWPARAEPLLRTSLASRARDLAGALRRTVAATTESPAESPPTPKPAGPLATQLQLVAAVRGEVGVSPSMANALARMAILLESVESSSRVLSDTVTRAGEQSSDFDEALNDLAQQIGVALEEIADALADSRVPTPYATELDRALLAVEEAQSRITKPVARTQELVGWTAGLRDLIAGLRLAEEISTRADSQDAGLQPPADATGFWASFQPDPHRMRIALRTATAVVAAFLVPMVLGWSVNTLIAPITFLLAASATRGAASRTLFSLAVVVALGWLIADLVLVYITPHVHRAPEAFVPGFVIAAAFAYASVGRPVFAVLPSIGGLVALLSIYGGASAPMDVYGPYNTVCYMGVAVGVGWLAGRILWPATAARLFRQRLASQLERCLETVREAYRDGDTGRAQRVRSLMHDSAVQLVQLGPLHAQAAHEPVERALDPTQRARILSLSMDLVNAVASHRAGSVEPILEPVGSAYQPLLEALRDEDAALLDSMQASVDALRDAASPSVSTLLEANRATQERLDELAATPPLEVGVSDDERTRVLIELDSRRRLIFRQREIEDWWVQWRHAADSED
jgi:uncharacterized membrane protein YccC